LGDWATEAHKIAGEEVLNDEMEDFDY
jgi:hypothetical protein